MLNTNENPKCRDCGDELTNENWSFSRRKNKSFYCRKCCKIRQHQWRIKNSTAKLEYAKKWRAEHIEHRKAYAKRVGFEKKQIVLSHYSNGALKCACLNCNEQHIEFLTLDHINNDGYKESVSHRKTLYFYLFKMGLPEGYQVLCYNCNNTKAHYGSCPHNL